LGLSRSSANPSNQDVGEGHFTAKVELLALVDVLARSDRHRFFSRLRLSTTTFRFLILFAMASTLGPAARLLARPQTATALLRQANQSQVLRATSQFHTSASRNALPAGPPPKGYRLPPPKRFDEGQSSLNQASNYFLLTEMFRGMYVVLEQFFRPP